MFLRRPTFALLTALSLAACSRESAPAIDEALRQDLSLAGQAFAPQQFVSPLEAGYQPYGYAPGGYQPVYGPQPVATRRAPTTRAVRRASGAATQQTRVVKHTRRDAAIGAAAGAAIGAVTTSKKDRLKGAVIGAVAGAVLGGVIGNNVDKSRVPQ